MAGVHVHVVQQIAELVGSVFRHVPSEGKLDEGFKTPGSPTLAMHAKVPCH